MSWFKRYPVGVNLVLGFIIALLAALWANYFASATDQMEPLKHLLLVFAGSLLFFQFLYNRNKKFDDEKSSIIIKKILRLGRDFLVGRSTGNVNINNLRAFVHFVEKAKPGEEKEKQRCLVPRHNDCHIDPRDSGVIPLDEEPFKWFVNVTAFHQDKVVCLEPDPNKRPSSDGFYLATASVFNATTVISIPIRLTKPDSQIKGTLTFDAKYGLSQLNWKKNGQIDESIERFLLILAELIARIITDESETF